MKRTRACAITVKEDKVCLLWRKVNGNAYFVFPGGGKENNETVEEAVAREAFEESSLVVKAEKLLYKLTDENSEHYFFLCSYVSGEPKLGNGNEFFEASESNQFEPMWKNVSELKTLTIFPLEIRDWLIEDIKDNFIQTPRELNCLVSERRKV